MNSLKYFEAEREGNICSKVLFYWKEKLILWVISFKPNIIRFKSMTNDLIITCWTHLRDKM